ncbi:uncharacterized protein LOC141849080 [Brevipalpus obovatus]|uniref:uncharacterized protein LOC141849080 n=1 Tax=Brevipalpus obovatus TaxID=246614 RepID=UPI003D9F2CD8
MVYLTPISMVQRPTFGRNTRFKNRRLPFRYDKIQDPILVERTPMRLRNWITGGKNARQDAYCMKEMLNLFNCMKVNDFSEKDCPEELAAFKTCHTQFLEEEKARALIKDPTEPISGEKNLTHRQINALLSKYPQRLDI